MLYELLTGKNPFEHASNLQERLAGLEQPIIYVRKLAPQIPRDLGTICHKCLEYRPDQRYASAAELRDDLDRFLRGEPTHARPLHLIEQVWRWSLRHRTMAGILCMVMIASSLILAQNPAQQLCLSLAEFATF